MEVIAKKTKELQVKTLVEAIIPLCLGIIVLIVEIACAGTLGWRGFADVLYILLMLACFGFFGWEAWQCYQMSKVADDVITYEDGKVTFSGILTCEAVEIERLIYEISEESANKDWGSLYFTIKGKTYTCPLIADIKDVYARLLELGAKATANEIAKKAEEVVEESATEEVASEEVEEATTEEVAVTEENQAE